MSSRRLGALTTLALVVALLRYGTAAFAPSPTGPGRQAPPITAQQQWITVEDPRPFRRCQDVLVDGESMHVWATYGHVLHVLRGYFSTAALHQAGTRISPHYSYRSGLSNCRITGPA